MTFMIWAIYQYIKGVENLLPICYFNNMAMHLVIDGYNLIGAMTDLAGMDLEGIREELITRLLAYKRLKKHRITVVFDGKRSGNLSRSSMNQKGIEVIFSREGDEGYASTVKKGNPRRLSKEERKRLKRIKKL